MTSGHPEPKGPTTTGSKTIVKAVLGTTAAKATFRGLFVSGNHVWMTTVTTCKALAFARVTPSVLEREVL